VEPEPIEIPIVSTLQAPETLAEVETPPVLPAAAETAIAPEGDTSKDAIIPVVDDLCRIAGIGPKVAALLNTAGVSTFAELAAATPAHLREALQASGLRFMDPDTWPQQAKLADQGDWQALASLQAALKGGRRV
jgi:large subunit ribosomal protein L17